MNTRWGLQALRETTAEVLTGLRTTFEAELGHASPGKTLSPSAECPGAADRGQHLIVRTGVAADQDPPAGVEGEYLH
jgi:hypothetical protein